MKRILASAVVTAVMLAGAGSDAQAQQINRRASLFDLGVYGGASYTTRWAETSAGDLGIRWNPVFGAQATYWIRPTFGVRANGAYIPSGWGYTENGGLPDFTGKEGRDVNNWLYDLDLVVRPFFFRTSMPNIFSSLYLFVGGGGLTTNVAGSDGCREPDTARGVCLPRDAKKATVGQGTAGLGLDLISFANNFGVFVEYGAHGYESPAHTGSGWVGFPEPSTTHDKFAVTHRGVLGLKMSFGNILPPPPVPVAPAPPPPPPPPPAPPAERAITVCVVQDQMLTTVNAMYNPTTGDTMVTGRRFSEAYPATAPTYVAGSTWYVNNEPIMYNGRRYVKFGLPRVIGTTDVMRAGAYQGTNVFVETGTTGTPTVIYLPVRPGCEFQPYQAQAEIKVRG